jgi:hypothetical protein
MNIEITEIPSPLLEFGGPGEFTEPKFGLTQAGPFDLRFGAAHKSHVKLGLVGPSEMIEKALNWYRRCQGPIMSGMENVAQYPFFPGFNEVFKAKLEVSDRWVVEFENSDELIEAVLDLPPKARFEQMLNLYAHGVEKLSDLESQKPDIVVCCLPQSVVASCWSISNELGIEEYKALKRQQARSKAAQMELFSGWEVEEQPEDLLFRDFRRALKARSMRSHMPIQIGRDRVFLDSEAGQDPATRAWNMSVALYYKSGGIPWRLKAEGPETCFVGVSFHHLRTTKRHLVHSSIAQAFSAEGDGFAIRGDSVPWNPEQGRNVHLTDEQSARLMRRVLEQYRERTGGDPLRVVLHKTSKFNDAEMSGFRSALRHIPVAEMVNLLPSMFRLVQYGSYPPKRGTMCRVNNAATYLFTTGFMSEWGTYPGPHIPTPVRLLTGDDVNMYRVASDVMGLTRMNWNTAQNTNGQPVTIRFARQVGGIMSELGEDVEPLPSYRYYM